MQPPPLPLPLGAQHGDRRKRSERARPSRVRFEREVVDDLGISTTSACALPPPSVERHGRLRLAHIDRPKAARKAAQDEAKRWTWKTQVDVAAKVLFVQEESDRAIRLVELAMRKMAVCRAIAATYRANGAMSHLSDALPEGEPVDFLKRALLRVFTIGAAQASAFAVLDEYVGNQLVADHDHLLQVGVQPTTAKRLLARHRLAGYLRTDGALRRLRSAVSRMQAAASPVGVALALPLNCAARDAYLRDFDNEVRHAIYEAAMAVVRLDGVRQEAEAALGYVPIVLHVD